MLDDIGQRLLHDPVRGEVKSRRQRDSGALNDQVDVPPGRAQLIQQGVQLAEAGRRAEWPVRLVAEDTEQLSEMVLHATNKRLLRQLRLPVLHRSRRVPPSRAHRLHLGPSSWLSAGHQGSAIGEPHLHR